MDVTLSPSDVEAPRRRSLAPYLLAVLVFQVGLYGGMLLSPLSPFAWGRGTPAAAAAASPLARWRQSLADPARDPRPGARPRLRLTGASGQPLDLEALAQRKTILVFASAESG